MSEVDLIRYEMLAVVTLLEGDYEAFQQHKAKALQAYEHLKAEDEKKRRLVIPISEHTRYKRVAI